MAQDPYNSREFLIMRNCLKIDVKDNLSEPHRNEEELEIRKLKMKVEHASQGEKIQKLTLGQKTSSVTKVIMLVGATGTGKTTLINAMVNFIYGVAFEDDFRFILIDNEDVSRRSKAESQTDFVTAYTFYHSPGMPFGYNYVLIDTPGYGDTRGIERDQEMAKQLEAFLKRDYGVYEVDAIGFVTPVSVARLTQFERYVYDGLSSLFGRDVNGNVYIMATFADAKNPPVQEALKEAGISYAGFYKFNNSALFAKNHESYTTHEESDFDIEDSVYISRLFWEAGYRSMRNFFLKLSKTNPVSLRLTRDVLKERACLQLIVSGLQEQIHIGLQKLGVLKQERINLSQIFEDIKGSSNFQEEVKVTKIRKIDLKPGEHVTNCLNCNFTCHYPCSRGDDMKWRCSSMNQRYCCVQCPAQCNWSHHKNMRFRYENTLVKEQRINQRLLERYHQARFRKTSKEREIRALEREIENLSWSVRRKIKEARDHMKCLDGIALKPNPLYARAYIDLLIESEKVQKDFKFEDRISMLQNFKHTAAVFEGIKGHCQASGESLLEHFQGLMSG